jgi:L-threonylcarbamoyladenylate synthase
VTLDQLRVALPDTEVAPPDADTQARSPGTKHRHYAPDARVRLVDKPNEAEPGADHAYIGLTPPDDPDAFGRAFIPDTVEAYAHELFHFFRTCDASGCTRIYCQTVDSTGLGQALMDRLQRAASAHAE